MAKKMLSIILMVSLLASLPIVGSAQTTDTVTTVAAETTMDPGQEMTFSVCLHTDGVMSVAIQLADAFDSSLFEFVSGQWLVEGVMSGVDAEKLNAVIAFEAETAVTDTAIFSFTLRAKADVVPGTVATVEAGAVVRTAAQTKTLTTVPVSIGIGKLTETLILEETKSGVTLKVYAISDGTHKMVLSGNEAMPNTIKTMTGYTDYKATTVELVVEEGITGLAYGGFSGFKALKSVTLSTTCITIPATAFNGCSALTAIDLTYVKTIGNKAFMASGLTEVTVPGGVTMGDAVFYGCTSLVTANIGNVYVNTANGLKLQVPTQAFVNCTALKTVTFGNKLNTINTAAFKNTGLESVTIPGNIKTISSNAFVNNKALRTLVLEEGVRTIGYNAFAACVALEEVVLPDSVTGASTGAFYSCYNIQKVTVGAGLAATGKDMFLDNRGLTEVVLPETLTVLGNRTFFKCGKLTDITLPESLTTVNKLAFYACYSLPEIKIPANVTTIGDNAFDGCKAMKTVYVDSATIAADLTSNKSAGCLVRYADTVYVRSDITDIGTYITANYTNAGTVTVDGVEYVTYTK